MDKEKRALLEQAARCRSAAVDFSHRHKAAKKLKKMAVVPCYGVNTCKALGECSGESHGCAAQNECRGQGWVPVPQKSCVAIGGSLTPVAAKK